MEFPPPEFYDSLPVPVDENGDRVEVTEADVSQEQRDYALCPHDATFTATGAVLPNGAVPVFQVCERCGADLAMVGWDSVL